jgi:hypothetical protein
MNLWFVLHVVGTRMSAQVRPPQDSNGNAADLDFSCLPLV